MLENSAVSMFEDQNGVKVNNLSCYGQTVKRILQKGAIDKYISSLNKDKQNIAVIELGGNDADFDWRAVAKDPTVSHQPKTSVKEFAKCYGECIDKLNSAGVKTVVCTIVPIDSKRFFNRVIGGLADKSRVLEFFNGDFNTIHRHQEMFNNEILKLAYKRETAVIDLRQKFLDTNDFESLMCQDGIHPNASGQKQILNAINEFLATA